MRSQVRAVLGAVALLATAIVSHAEDAWMMEAPGALRTRLESDADGWVTFDAVQPGGGAVYREPERESFRPDPTFWKRFLRLDIASAPDSEVPAEFFLFVKDKDGLYFQSVNSFTLAPGEEKTFEIELSRDAGAWRPVGHRWEWSALMQATIFNAGIQLSGTRAGKVRLRCRDLCFEEERIQKPLTVNNWQLPDAFPARKKFESRFDLSREYFNAFDPDLVAVDARIHMPNGESIEFPAFFGQDYRRERHFSSERIEPVGRPYWAFRFTPPAPGEYAVELQVTDRTGSEPEVVTTPPRRFTVSESTEKGFVRLDERTGHFFRFDNGEPFYPVGLNIHTNIDLRSEAVFGFPPQSDEGTYDYDTYLEAASAHGINTVEIWMAAWAFALEWDSARSGYYGMGRYNLGNAWRLDHMMERADELDMYYHLNLDNHGKMSSFSDQEWHENPLNTQAPFAAANGAVLELPGQFFNHSNDDSPVARYYWKRNRYIAARWGAEPRIFGIEFWNEIDLTNDFRAHYEAGRAQSWHLEAGRVFRQLDTGKHLLTTHVCGDFNNNRHYRNLWEGPALDYVVGDAYYDSNGPRLFIDLLKEHAEAMKTFDKPAVITEFGGSAAAGPRQRVTADLHSGLWGAFFLGQAGTPFLWWHDFVHLTRQYRHYDGFARFIDGIDRGAPEWREGRFQVAEGVEALAFGKEDAGYVWIFRRDAMYSYPEEPEAAPENAGLAVEWAETPLAPGRWRADFYHTVTGEAIAGREVDIAGNVLNLPLPDFRIDLAVKLTRVPQP